MSDKASATPTASQAANQPTALRAALLVAEVSTLSVSSLLAVLSLAGVYPALRTAMSRALETYLHAIPAMQEEAAALIAGSVFAGE